MEITLTIPEDIAKALAGETGDVAHTLLELAGNDAFLRGRISERQLQILLGFETRFDVHKFLKLNQNEFDAQSQLELDLLDREFHNMEHFLATPKAERSV